MNNSEVVKVEEVSSEPPLKKVKVEVDLPPVAEEEHDWLVLSKGGVTLSYADKKLSKN